MSTLSRILAGKRMFVCANSSSWKFKTVTFSRALKIVDVGERPGSSDGLEYDPEWLAILKATNSLQRTTPVPWNPPENNGLHERYIDIKTYRNIHKVTCPKSRKIPLEKSRSISRQFSHFFITPQYWPAHGSSPKKEGKKEREIFFTQLFHIHSFCHGVSILTDHVLRWPVY